MKPVITRQYQTLPIPESAEDVPGIVAIAISYAEWFGWQPHSVCLNAEQCARLGDGPGVERREDGVYIHGVPARQSNGDPPYLFMLERERAVTVS